MWGAPLTGKTTFLAALAEALSQYEEDILRLRGTDDLSTLKLGEMRDQLVNQGIFPEASVTREDYNWELVEPDRYARQRFLFFWRRRDRSVRTPLLVRDSPGRDARPQWWLNSDGNDLIEQMHESAGLILLYDPVSEAVNGDAYKHVGELLAQLDQKSGGAAGGYLPHYLAVCITKFDEQKVLDSAQAAHLVNYVDQPYGCPSVDPELAEEFFHRMCTASPNPAARSLPNLLSRTFHPDRTQYFVTSAIGFYVDAVTGSYDAGDAQNVIRGAGKPKIRDAIHPINVVEPILWLLHSARRGAR
jgi:hypothetical protein